MTNMEKIPIGKIKPNPKNPRFIRDDKFRKLVESVTSFPEMSTVRPVVVNKQMVILGGNMRYRAMKEAGYTEIDVTVVDWPKEKQDEFVIKDNVSGGEWDWSLLANEWNEQLLVEWGLDLPVPEKEASEPPEKELVSKKVIEISFDDDETMETVFTELMGRGLSCRILTL